MLKCRKIYTAFLYEKSLPKTGGMYFFQIIYFDYWTNVIDPISATSPIVTVILFTV